MADMTWRAGNLLERLTDGVITTEEQDTLIKNLEKIEQDPALPAGIRVAAAAILSAIHARLISVRH